MGIRTVNEYTCDVCTKVETDADKLKTWRNVSSTPVPAPPPTTIEEMMAAQGARGRDGQAAVVCGKGCRNKWSASLDAPAKAPAA